MKYTFPSCCYRIIIIDGKEPRVILHRWTYMEIEMIKAQIKEFRINVEEKKYGPLPPRPLLHKHHRRKKQSYYLKKPYCRTCRKYFKNTSLLAIHRRTCLKEDVFNEKKDKCNNEAKKMNPFVNKITCKDCKSSFGSTREFFRHRQYLDCSNSLARDEESDLSENTDEEYEYDFLYTCKVCRAKFIFKELLTIHRIREKHLREKKSSSESDFLPIQTDSEDFNFISIKEGEYSCTVCNNGFVYYDLDNLLKHHRVVHNSSTEIFCRYCSQKLNNLSEFEEHHKIYHELENYCQVCNNKEYYNNSNSLPPKPVCLVCCWRYNMPFDNCLSLLKENLYCDDCEQVLPSLAHVKFHNCDKKKDPLLALALLVCPLCLDTYNSLRSLYRHIIRHNDLMPFKCHVCESVHETVKNLKEHVQKCHFNEELRLPKADTSVLRRNAEDVIDKFVTHGVKLLI